NEREDLWVVSRNRDQGAEVKEYRGSIDLEDCPRKHSDCLCRAKTLIIRRDYRHHVRIVAAGDLRRGLERNQYKGLVGDDFSSRINERSPVNLDGHRIDHDRFNSTSIGDL